MPTISGDKITEHSQAAASAYDKAHSGAAQHVDEHKKGTSCQIQEKGSREAGWTEIREKERRGAEEKGRGILRIT